jgi:uncharacterized membrane protein
MKQLKVSLSTNPLDEDGQTFLFINGHPNNHVYHPMYKLDHSYQQLKTSAALEIRSHNREMSIQKARSSSRSGGGFGGGSSFGGGGGGGRSR